MDLKLPDGADFYLQFIIGGTGLLAFIIRLRNHFSESRKKQNLKTDLEILNLADKSNLQETQVIRDRVGEQLNESYNKEVRGSSGISNFTTGLIVFIGFGLWSADLFKRTYPEFNPWTILTLLCSITGLSMILFDERKVDKLMPFITIGIYDKSNLKWSFVVLIVCTIILTYLILSNNQITFGMFFSGLFCFISASAIIRSIKRIR